MFFPPVFLMMLSSIYTISFAWKKTKSDIDTPLCSSNYFKSLSLEVLPDVTSLFLILLTSLFLSHTINSSTFFPSLHPRKFSVSPHNISAILSNSSNSTKIRGRLFLVRLIQLYLHTYIFHTMKIFYLLLHVFSSLISRIPYVRRWCPSSSLIQFYSNLQAIVHAVSKFLILLSPIFVDLGWSLQHLVLLNKTGKLPPLTTGHFARSPYVTIHFSIHLIFFQYPTIS